MENMNETANASITNATYYFTNETYYLPHEDFFFVLNHMTLYVLPVEIFLGCVGNLLAFYVLVASHLIQQSCNVYLAFLTFVDTGFLTCTLFVWIDFITHSVFSLNGFCQGIPYLTYVFSFLSGYTVLSFTVERFIVTFYPLQRQHMCSTRRAKIVVLCLSLFAFAFYSFPLYMSTVVKYEGYQECRPLVHFIKIATILSSIDSIITLLLPSVMIIVLNISIAVKISRIFSATSRQRLGQYTTVTENREMDPVQQYPVRKNNKILSFRTCTLSKNESNAIVSRHSSVRSDRPLVQHRASIVSCTAPRNQVRTTRTLVVLSSLFVLLKLPSHALRLHTFIGSFLSHPQPSHSDTMLLLAWQEICQFIYYLNFAGNFFLYCLLLSTFRDVACTKLKLIFCYNNLSVSSRRRSSRISQ